ncbi:MAG: plastocyanin/azurin family copper-binding protein [Acidimicrobiia bacterium]
MLLILAASALVGCGEDRNDALGPDAPTGEAPPAGTAVNGVEREWVVLSDLDQVPAGPVTFTFTNAGTTVHEMLVVKTDLPLFGLPVDPMTQRFSEESTEWEVISEIPEYEVGETKDLTLTLEPGRYQLVCNLPAHYANGMATALQVYS